ncbi:MAG: precorrin-8X methylmutase [Desulfovibrionaceae bacterium]|nr:precorrin-8X methylmutase [Desulfovibrionaceae bacterium]
MEPMVIERGSMAIIESEVPEPRPYADHEWLVVRRMIHTTADFEMLDLVRFHPRATAAGRAALARGCAIFTDTEMARAGIPLRRMEPLGCTVSCLMSDPDVAAAAKAAGTTRAVEAIDRAVARGGASIFVIGNAPTALLRLLEHMDKGAARPDLVVGMPVGFVNAAESKALLMARQPAAAPDSVPWVVIEGRKGGSALAATVINALADTVLAER